MSDGIDKKWRNKKLELRQNIIENRTNHEVKPCFKKYLGIILYSEHLFRSKNLTKNYYIWFEQLNKVLDGIVGRNENNFV